MNAAEPIFIILIWAVAIAVFVYANLRWFTSRSFELGLSGRGRDKGKLSVKSFLDRSATEQRTPNVLFFFVAVAAAVFGFLVWKSLLTAVIFMLAGFIIPRFLYGRRVRKRKKLMQEQFGPALWLVVNSMRAGQNLAQAFNTATTDLKEPMSSEFGNLSRQIRLGVPMEKALEDFDRRINSSESRTIVKAMIISLRTGANLPEAMGRIAVSINTRVKLERKVRALTAQGKAQGWIMSAIPFVLAGAFSLINRSYAHTLFQTIGGNVILSIVIVMQVFAFIFIRNITRVPT